MDEKDTVIENLQNRVKELEQQNKNLLDKIVALTLSYVKLSEEIYYK